MSEHGPRDLSLRLVLAGTALVLAAFAGKAFHVDDPSFLRAARHLSIAPLDPWGFTSFWSGAVQPAHQHVNHPPLQAYVVWLGTRIGGFRETVLHLVQIPVALAALVATARAARRLGAAPGIAALATAATPAFLVSFTTLMSDGLFLATWTGAVASWLDASARSAGGDARGARRGLALAALLATACTLTRYNGIALVPLLALHTLVERRVGPAALAWLVLPIAALAGEQAFAFAQHRHVPMRSASRYAALSDDGVARVFDLWIGVVHTGACLASAAFLAPRLWSWRAVTGALALALAIAWAVPHGLGVALGVPATALDRAGIALQIGLWTSAGIGIVALVLADLWQRRDAGAWLLAAWCAGVFVFATLLNWTVNARSFLPLAPAIAILVARRLARRGDAANGASSRARERAERGARERAERGAGERAGALARDPWPAFALGLAALLAILVARGDAAFANALRALAQETGARARAAGVRVWFRGHWGWQWYLEQAGARGLDPMRATIATGDWVALPSWEPADAFFAGAPLEERERLGPLAPGHVATLDRTLGAGFYANATFGPLPFAFGEASPLEVRVLHAQRGFRMGVAAHGVESAPNAAREGAPNAAREGVAPRER